MLRRERAAQLLGREQSLLDEYLAVPRARLRRRLLGRFDLQGIRPVVREHHVRQRVRSGERGGAAHVAGSKEGPDFTRARGLDHQRATGSGAEHRRHQLGGARRAQVSLCQ